jgi:ParB-like chromosome segregation protein Spo0J
MLAIETRPLARLIPYVRNARTHSSDQIAQIAGSIAEFGFVNPVLIGTDDVIIAGHGRVLAAGKLGLAEVPVIVLSHLSDSQRRALVIADNRIAENAGWDEAMLKAEIAALQEDAFDLDLLGFAEEELGRLLDGLDAEIGGEGVADGEETADASTETQRATLAERFGIPPFSVLDARKGWWQDRKRAWIDLGIRSELGRGEGATYGTADGVSEPGLNDYRNRNTAAPGGSPRPLDRGWTGKKDKSAHG